MHGAREALVIALTEKLPRDDGAARTETDAEPDGELGQRRGGLNAAEGDLSAELPDDKRVYEVVRLLEERGEEDRYTQRQELPPDDALGDVDRSALPLTRHRQPQPLAAFTPRRSLHQARRDDAGKLGMADESLTRTCRADRCSRCRHGGRAARTRRRSPPRHSASRHRGPWGCGRSCRTRRWSPARDRIPPCP